MSAPGSTQEPEPLAELLTGNGVPDPRRLSRLPDELLERSFQLNRELLRLASPVKGLIRFHPERKLLGALYQELEELVALLAEERLARGADAQGYKGLDVVAELVRRRRGGAA